MSKGRGRPSKIKSEMEELLLEHYPDWHGWMWKMKRLLEEYFPNHNLSTSEQLIFLYGNFIWLTIAPTGIALPFQTN